jgi:hypothetical protein
VHCRSPGPTGIADASFAAHSGDLS